MKQLTAAVSGIPAWAPRAALQQRSSRRSAVCSRHGRVRTKPSNHTHLSCPCKQRVVYFLWPAGTAHYETLPHTASKQGMCSRAWPASLQFVIAHRVMVTATPPGAS